MVFLRGLSVAILILILILSAASAFFFLLSRRCCGLSRRCCGRDRRSGGRGFGRALTFPRLPLSLHLLAHLLALRFVRATRLFRFAAFAFASLLGRRAFHLLARRALGRTLLLDHLAALLLGGLLAFLKTTTGFRLPLLLARTFALFACRFLRAALLRFRLLSLRIGSFSLLAGGALLFSLQPLRLRLLFLTPAGRLRLPLHLELLLPLHFRFSLLTIPALALDPTFFAFAILTLLLRGLGLFS